MPRPFFTLIAVLVLAGGLTISGADAADARAVESLRKEVSAKGYLVASIKQARGDWDLVLMRPDGSEQRKLTDTPAWSEAAPRWSPDSRRLLYRRIKTGTVISHDRW
ncbi:MAG TPA: hypothetical protein DCE43_16375, partial [Planctomycetaceae bacterium]|nr:hypothetical protein [Planctomycetaceae bacterium]